MSFSPGAPGQVLVAAMAELKPEQGEEEFPHILLPIQDIFSFRYILRYILLPIQDVLAKTTVGLRENVVPV